VLQSYYKFLSLLHFNIFLTYHQWIFKLKVFSTYKTHFYLICNIFGLRYQQIHIPLELLHNVAFNHNQVSATPAKGLKSVYQLHEYIFPDFRYLNDPDIYLLHV
jgi:hypothetical protein